MVVDIRLYKNVETKNDLQLNFFKINGMCRRRLQKSKQDCHRSV